MEEIESRMVIDSQWDWQVERTVYTECEKERGYRSFHGNEFISEEDAFEYALEHCLKGSEEEKKEFREMLVEWYFSGNWVKEG